MSIMYVPAQLGRHAYKCWKCCIYFSRCVKPNPLISRLSTSNLLHCDSLVEPYFFNTSCWGLCSSISDNLGHCKFGCSVCYFTEKIHPRSRSQTHLTNTKVTLEWVIRPKQREILNNNFKFYIVCPVKDSENKGLFCFCFCIPGK